MSPPTAWGNAAGRLIIHLRDVGGGLRAGRGTYGLAFVILTLTLAAATVMFAVVDAVVLRPLPFAEPGRLVGISPLDSTSQGSSLASPQQYFDWSDRLQATEGVGAARAGGRVELVGPDGTESLLATRVTTGLFDLLGVRPAVGRFFSADDDRSAGRAGVVLSHAFWTRRFAADPSVVGRRLAFADGNRTVLGVMAADAWFPITSGPRPDLYLAYRDTPAERANNRGFSLSVVGRLREGVSLEQARADVVRASSFPVAVVPLHDQIVGDARRWLLLVLLAVAIVWVVAIVNVAALLLVRATARAPEFAIRLMLGASAARLGSYLMVEGVILILVSGAAAAIIASWGLGIATQLLPPGLTRVPAIAVNVRVLSVAVATALLSGMVVGGATAYVAARAERVSLIHASGAQVFGSRIRSRTLASFLVIDVAFVSFLLVAATLVVASFVRVTTTDLGFNRHNVASVSYQRSLASIAAADRTAAVSAIRSSLLERLSAVPGVTGVALTSGGSAPLSGNSVRYSLAIPGREEIDRESWLESNNVTPEYFRVMGVPLVEGRQFRASDRPGAPLVMIINAAAARRLFPDRSPIGQVAEFDGLRTIVGVVADLRFDGPEAEVRPAMYFPADQQRIRRSIEAGTVLVRTSGDPRALTAQIRNAMRPVLGGEPGTPRFIADDFRRITAERRFTAALMATFAVIVLLIGALGIYGTAAFVVSRGARAIGLRKALGASSGSILRMILVHTLSRVVLGTALGLACAWALSNTLRSLVFGIQPTEPVVYLAVAGFLVSVGAASALVPALHASRLDPNSAMRRE